jgi:hypothetical protein
MQVRGRKDMIPSWCIAVCDRLEQAGVQYVAVGGTAVVLHGFLRPSEDLDLVISRAPDNVTRAMHALMLAGFMPSLPLPMSAVTVMRMFDSSQREVDVFARYAIPFEELWASAEAIQVNERVVRIMSRDHLLRVKRLYPRPQDLQDIAGLLALESSHATSAPASAHTRKPDSDPDR